MGNKYYLRVTVPPDQITAAQSLLAEAVASGEVVAGEVVVDGAEVESSARDAASAASSATTLQAAAEEFVTKMHLDDGVDRAAVAARVRRYLGLPGGA